MPFSVRRHLPFALTLAAGVACFSPAASTAAATPTDAATARFQIPVGDVHLDIDVPQIDEKLGGAFVLGVRSGANNCYVESLSAKPGQEGEIAFVVKPPQGEGRFLVTVNPKGTLDPSLVDCVRDVFNMFYHYRDKTPFESVPGTLTFTPRTVAAPPPPTDAELRATLDARYADAKVVRIASVAQRAVSLDAGSSTEVFRRYVYAVDLVFVADGYESTCVHYEPYKVFTTRPYASPFAGHSCASKARKAGEHTEDSAQLTFALKLWPEVAATWEWRGSGITGTLPSIEP